MSECPWCGCDEMILLGALGARSHYRCRNCGNDSSEVDAPDHPEYTESKSMTLDEAGAICKAMRSDDATPFTAQEREAIKTIGAAFLMREITRERMAELMGVTVADTKVLVPS